MASSRELLSLTWHLLSWAPRMGSDSCCGKSPGKYSAIHTRAPVSLKQRNSMEYFSVAHSGVRQESTAIIYQQNPINMIYQQGTNNHISIANSEAIQIGHGNAMLRQIDCDQRGKRRGLAGTPAMPEWGEKVRGAWSFKEKEQPPHLHGQAWLFSE